MSSLRVTCCKKNNISVTMCACCFGESAIHPWPRLLLSLQTVAAVRQLQVLNPGMHVLTELQLPENLMYLDAFGGLMDFQEGNAAAMTVPVYMAGDVLLPQLVDCLLCQVRKEYQVADTQISV